MNFVCFYPNENAIKLNDPFTFAVHAGQGKKNVKKMRKISKKVLANEIN